MKCKFQKKIFIADGDIFSKEYEKYLFTYNKTNHVFDYQTYTNSMHQLFIMAHHLL